MIPRTIFVATFLLASAQIPSVVTSSVTSTIACEGAETSMTSYECRQQQVISTACYYDGYNEGWKSCGSICNGALFVGTRGRSCKDYCADYFIAHCRVSKPEIVQHTTSPTAVLQGKKQTTQHHTSLLATSDPQPINGHSLFEDANVARDASVIGLACMVVAMISFALICYCKEQGKNCSSSKEFKKIADLPI